MTIDLFLLQTMFIRLIVDWSTFSSYAISASVVDCAHNVATFLRLSSILKLCVTKISLCTILWVDVMFMYSEQVWVTVRIISRSGAYI